MDGVPTHDVVALKFYYNREHNQRVEREINAMESIRHRALAALIEHGELLLDSEPLRYVAWEFVEGTPIVERVGSGTLAPHIVAAVGRDISSAIAELWRHRIVHRDVKPDNIMLRTGDREAVLIDLGIARHLQEPSITAYGLTYGTPGYMSPEHAQGTRQLTGSSDIFSLGLVLRQLLAGVHPTGGRQEGLSRPLSKTVVDCPMCPVALANVIDQMLALRPAFRPQPALLVEQFTSIIEFMSGER
jgi:serine/threonine-protein kinase